MILNCPSTIAYRQRIGHDTIQEQWQRVLRTRIAPTEDDRALNAPAIIPAEAQESLALLVCEAIKRKGLLIGPAAKAAVVVERVLHNQAPIMAFYGGASLHQDLPDRKPSALDFAGLCSDDGNGLRLGVYFSSLPKPRNNLLGRSATSRFTLRLRAPVQRVELLLDSYASSCDHLREFRVEKHVTE
jgi:hypothetical protein